MDQGQPPSSTPTTPAGSPGDISPALPNAPETRPTEAPGSTAASPPEDPYADYTHIDYQQLMEEHPIPGMDVKELGSVFPAAHRAIAEFGAPGLEAVLELTGAGDDPNLIRGLSAFHQDYLSLIQEARQMNADLASRSRQLGQREPRIADAPPLNGQALEAKIGQILDRYLPASGSRSGLEALGFFRDPAVRRTLVSMAQETSRLERALQQAGGLQQQMKSAWESPSTLLTMPDGRRFTREELKAEYGELMQQWMAADKRGDLATKERLQQQMNKVGRIAFS